MDRQFLKKLFHPFERASDSTSSKMTGTGLGMAITKNIIDLMSGDIQVEQSRKGICLHSDSSAETAGCVSG